MVYVTRLTVSFVCTEQQLDRTSELYFGHSELAHVPADNLLISVNNSVGELMGKLGFLKPHSHSEWSVIFVHCYGPSQTGGSRPGLTKLRHAVRFPWHMTFTAVLIFFNSFCLTSVSILWTICVYIQISDCIETEHELLVLTNNTASGMFLHRLAVMRTGDCKFIIGAPAWRGLGWYVTLHTFYNILL